MPDFSRPDIIANFEYKEGALYWLVSPADGKPAGMRAGHKDKRSCSVGLNYKKMRTHRAIWILLRGDIPCGMEIDHINRDPFDNRIENLRLASKTQNSANKCANKNKKSSEYRGVISRRKGNKTYWIAHVWRRQIIMRSEIEAALAYNFYARARYGEFALLNEVHVG